MPNANLQKSPPSEIKPRKPMTEEQKQAARERMALARAAKGQVPKPAVLEVEPPPAPSPTPFNFNVALSARTMGRLQCLLDAKDFNFVDHDDLIMWLLRQAAASNRTAAFHLNMRYQRERAEAL